MIKKQITIINKLGLHARAAMKLVNLAGRYASEITIFYQGREVNAKSIMNVMVLAANKGTVLVFQIDGEDEQQATEAIEALINDKFGEDE